LTWIYLSLLGAISAVGLISGVAIRFYQLNTAIRREILEKEMVTANLRILEKRYRILVENAPFPILISRLSDGLLLYVNPSAAQKLEMTQEHAIGKSSQDYYVNPGSRENLVTAIEQQGYIRNNEILLKSSTGREFWANLSATLISFEGEPAIFVAVVDVTEQKELERRLEVMAMTDDLTGLNNRRYFTRKGTEEFRRARRYTSALSVIMLDVDRFKSINDTYGHAAGDYVLKELAILIRQNLRDVDIPGRLGGEEFAILLPNTNHQSTLILAERLRQNIATHLFEINDQSIPSTASMGVASLNEDSVNLEELLNQADAALYRAKLQGRNRVGSSLEDKTNIS
jgi:diguanylate cyclase (GGDEF)-like protein/PAS domain S-box-containing protein